MAKLDDEARAYNEGFRAAINAISEGASRVIRVEGETSFDQPIDAHTGLPIAYLSGPPELAKWQAGFARGFNDEVCRAFDSGEIAANFTPLLMSLAEIKDAFVTHPLGTLSLENHRIEGPGLQFTIYLKDSWIALTTRDGETNPRLMNFEGPTKIAIGKETRVLLILTSHHYFAFDLVTTQILNRYNVR